MGDLSFSDCLLGGGGSHLTEDNLRGRVSQDVSQGESGWRVGECTGNSRGKGGTATGEGGSW